MDFLAFPGIVVIVGHTEYGADPVAYLQGVRDMHTHTASAMLFTDRYRH